jgi:hypothetical protein
MIDGYCGNSSLGGVSLPSIGLIWEQWLQARTGARSTAEQKQLIYLIGNIVRVLCCIQMVQELIEACCELSCRMHGMLSRKCFAALKY